MRGETGDVRQVSKEEYNAFRKVLLQDKSAILLHGNQISVFGNGRLTRMLECANTLWGTQLKYDAKNCEAIVRDPILKSDVAHVSLKDVLQHADPEVKTYPWPVITNAPIRFSIANSKDGPVYVMEGAMSYSQSADALGFQFNPDKDRWERSGSCPLSANEIRQAMPDARIEVVEFSSTALVYNALRDRLLVDQAYEMPAQPAVPANMEETPAIELPSNLHLAFGM